LRRWLQKHESAAFFGAAAGESRHFQMMVVRLEHPLALPCGKVLKNRVVKSALCEGLANFSNNATGAHSTLYQRWAQSGAGLLITGAVQVDRRYLDRPGDIVIEGPQNSAALAALRAMAEAAKSGGSAALMQLSHAGLASSRLWCSEPVGPSALESPARALTDAEIEDIIRRFIFATGIALECGFDGVQILAAHGRLLGSFLCPAENNRADAWGGEIHQRAALLLRIVRGVRAAFGAGVALSVKIDAHAGLSPDVAALAKLLGVESVDLLEATAGRWFSDREGLRGRVRDHVVDPQGLAKTGEALRTASRSLVVLSGGLRYRPQIEQMLDDGCMDAVGFGEAFCANPDFASALMRGDLDEAPSIHDIMGAAPNPLMGLLQKLENAAGLRAVAGQELCALAIEDYARGRETPQIRSAAQALRVLARADRAAVKGLAA
jgi:2,4-dienoyl-CoA reductase-like NADH-dependent reductase (Old Yellow Enzyme family)